MISDEALMLEFQRGSREAFEELFERYRGPLFGFLRRRLTSRERAEDLTQETFLAVVQATTRCEPRTRRKTYLYGIAFHLLATEHRKLKTNPVPNPASGEHRDLAVAESPEAALWVREALQKLDPTEREILMLREYEQLSYAEIASVLRLPVNTVRSRLFRSRMAVKQYLEPANETPQRQGDNAMKLSTHPVSQDELMAYLDGELPVNQAAAVAAHLEHCRECQALAADLESVGRRLLEWQIETPSDQMSEPVHQALDCMAQPPPETRRLSLKRPWIWIAASAGILIALINYPWGTPPRFLSTDTSWQWRSGRNTTYCSRTPSCG